MSAYLDVVRKLVNHMYKYVANDDIRTLLTQNSKCHQFQRLTISSEALEVQHNKYRSSLKITLKRIGTVFLSFAAVDWIVTGS